MNSRHCPALLIAAPASGQGKTTVTAALARLHSRAGKRVRVFKCGPDFLDPMILARASGAPVYQLDLWMVGEEECRRLLWQAAGEADLILIEGVMGLFDGAPSAADLARRFGVPVLGVIERGTTHAQRVEVADLATLAQRVLDEGVRPPSLTVVGTVVGLYPKLAWFEPQDQPKASPLPHAGCAVVHGKGEA